MISTITVQSLVTGQGTKYTLLNADGFTSPNVENAKFPLSGKHGIKFVRGLWRDRVVRLEYGLRESTVALYASLRDAFIAAFDLPRNGLTTVYMNTLDGRVLQFTASLNTPLDGAFEAGHITIGKIRVELLLDDPQFYSQDENTTDVYAPVAGGITLPTTIPFSISRSGGSGVITNNGNGVMNPVFRIYGPATNPHVGNSTKSLDFSLSTTIADGHYVEIDPVTQTVLYDDGSNYLQYFDGDWIFLAPGGNTITFNSDDNNAASYVRFYHRDAYIGI